MWHFAEFKIFIYPVYTQAEIKVLKSQLKRISISVQSHTYVYISDSLGRCAKTYARAIRKGAAYDV